MVAASNALLMEDECFILINLDSVYGKEAAAHPKMRREASLSAIICVETAAPIRPPVVIHVTNRADIVSVLEERVHSTV